MCWCKIVAYVASVLVGLLTGHILAKLTLNRRRNG